MISDLNTLPESNLQAGTSLVTSGSGNGSDTPHCPLRHTSDGAARAPQSLQRARPPLVFALSAETVAALSVQVSAEEITDCRRLLEALRRIHHAPKVRPACKVIEAEMRRGPVIADGRRQATWSAATLATKYYEFVKSGGDVLVCLNKAKAQITRKESEVQVNRRIAFIEFWRALGERNQRDWSAAYDELLHIWKTGSSYTRTTGAAKQYTSIPGYAEWPKEERHGHPAGWSYANLMRLVSDPYDQAAARIGYSKASGLRLPVLRDRCAVEFGRYVEFDDHEWNSKTLFQKKPMRPLGFGAIEVFTHYGALIGFKPTLWDFDEEAKKKLTEREFMWFVVAYVTSVGYRADIGTEFIVERGTAAIREEMEKRLFAVTNGKVTVFRGGRHGRPAHAGQFKGRSKGNFKTKAIVEGWWRILDDQMASLPGQVGKDRDHAPEQLHGQEQYTAQVMKAVEERATKGRPLSSEQLAMLQFPFPPFATWREWALDAVHRINTTRRHNLQGWQKLGFVQPIWRLSEGDPASDPTAQWLPWQKFLALPAEKQALVKAMLEANPQLVSERRLSRKEVFDANKHLLTRLPLELVPELVGPENAIDGGRLVPVERGLLTIEVAEIDPDPIRFYARRADGSFLPNGTNYVCFVNPYAPTHLIACAQNRDGKLTVAAICPRYELGTRSDVTAQLGAQAAFEAQARQRLNLRHAPEAEAKDAMIAHNRRILDVPQGTPPLNDAPPVPADDCTQDLLSREGKVAPADSWD